MNMAGMAMKRDQGPDLNDVTYDAFLANDRTLADPQTIKVEQGGQLLLRVINGSAMSNFHLDIGALDGELIAADGFEVKPIAGKTFPIAVAQRLDIRIRLPAGAGAYPIFALLEGTSRRTGIVLDAGGTITKMSDKAEKIEPAITLDLERQLEAVKPLRRREADRTHRLDLTGDMAKYVWSINNVVWTKDMPPLPVAEGERVELVLTNKTMMSHPMHLHGHEFQVVEIDGMRIAGAVRDTILVRPMGQVVVAFNANNPGWWAFHCHLLYHLDAGMFTTIRYV
jgi:FtsP/CotA-like multicopper oxidase with cupredoxin domain